MTLEEFNRLGTNVVTIGSIAVVSWSILMLQAFFHDKRIALVELFGALFAAYGYMFAKEAGEAIRATAAIAITGFALWFLATHLKKPSVWIPALVLVVSITAGWYLDNDIKGII